MKFNRISTEMAVIMAGENLQGGSMPTPFRVSDI